MTEEIERYYSPGRVAQMFEVGAATVRSWISEGKIKAIKLPGGHLRISESELKKFANVRYGDET